MGMKGFERRLERMVEGSFARVFRSGLRPIELGRKLVREMEAGQTQDVRGRLVMPNHFTVLLSDEDHARFADLSTTLCRELAQAARDSARERGAGFLGPVIAELATRPRFRSGSFAIEARFQEGIGGSGAGSLVLSDGTRVPIGAGLTLGRLSSCDIKIADDNASRNHAEIRPVGEGYVVVDLGSTNGTRVNGSRATDQFLRHGDQIGIGEVVLVFAEN